MISPSRLFPVWVVFACVFFRAAAAGSRCVVTPSSIRPTLWTLQQQQRSLILRFTLPDENRFEDDAFNFLQGAALSFGDSCDPLVSFTVVADEKFSLSAGSNWTVSYLNATTGSECGTWLFERAIPFAEALRDSSCFTKIWTQDLSSFRLESPVGRVRRVYGVTTRTFATTRFLEDSIQLAIKYAVISSFAMFLIFLISPATFFTAQRDKRLAPFDGYQRHRFFGFSLGRASH